MRQQCTVCQHAERAAIDKALVSPGNSARGVAKQFGLGPDAVQRHRARHVAQAVLDRAAAREVTQRSVAPNELERLFGKAKELGEEAERRNDLRTALNAVREMTRLYELQARLVLLARSDARDVSSHPVFLELRADLLAATRGCEACSQAIARKMRARLGDLDPGATP